MRFVLGILLLMAAASACVEVNSSALYNSSAAVGYADCLYFYDLNITVNGPPQIFRTVNNATNTPQVISGAWGNFVYSGLLNVTVLNVTNVTNITQVIVLNTTNITYNITYNITQNITYNITQVTQNNTSIMGCPAASATMFGDTTQTINNATITCLNSGVSVINVTNQTVQVINQTVQYVVNTTLTNCNLNLTFVPSTEPQVFVDVSKNSSIYVAAIPTTNSTNITLYGNSTTMYKNAVISCFNNVSVAGCEYQATFYPSSALQRVSNRTTGLDIIVQPIPPEYCYENRYEEVSNFTLFRSDRGNNTFICNPGAVQRVEVNSTCQECPVCAPAESCAENQLAFVPLGTEQNVTCENPQSVKLCPEEITSAEEGRAWFAGNATELRRLWTVECENQVIQLNNTLVSAYSELNTTKISLDAASSGSDIVKNIGILLAAFVIAAAFGYFYFTRTKTSTSVRRVESSPEKVEAVSKKFGQFIDMGKKEGEL